MSLLTLSDLERLPRIRFPAGNKVGYFQDFTFSRAMPSHLDFYIANLKNGSLQLVAPGYGIKGDYGNGCIFINIMEQPYD
jgi:hypothetical protein